MDEVNAFLAGMYENPDDDAPALAFADWLRENDRAIGVVLLALLRGGPAFGPPGRKVWLCSSGSYSEYTVDAVFLSEAEAKEYDRLRGQTTYSNVNEIEQMMIGRPANGQLLRDRYISLIDLITGEITHDEPDKVMASAGDHVNRSPTAAVQWIANPAGPRRRGGTNLCERISSYESQEHADKLAVEWRQEFLRLVGGVHHLVDVGHGIIRYRESP
jgi:uncharacterized protein (TIGR02996 family)